MIYQSLGLEDIQLIQKLGRATYEPYYPHIWLPGGMDWYMEHCFNETTLRTELSDPNYEFLMARNEAGQAVGFLKLVLEKPAPNRLEQQSLYLEKIYLMPDFYGQGFGQVLMEWVIERATALQRRAVWLMVLKNGPVKAYERAGFEIVGKTYWPFEYLKPEERHGLIMLRQLPLAHSV